MTYNVFGGTLNLAQLNDISRPLACDKWNNWFCLCWWAARATSWCIGV